MPYRRDDKLPWPPALGPANGMWIWFGLWLAISVFLIVSGWQTIVTRSGWDPDDQLRMVQLRDFLNGQSWFDTTQYRMNGDEGAPMHWSRLIELPLALIILSLSPIIGQPAAEMIAGTAVPLIGLGVVAYMIGRITAHLSSPEAGVVAVAITLISPALLMQFRPMRIDHHGWQIVMAVLALYTIFWPDKKRAGIVLGLALAIWLHISLEGAPMMAAFFLLLGWRWIFEKAHAQRLIWTTGSFALASIALFAGTQASPFSAAVYCDTISPPHIAAIIMAAAIMLPAIIATPKDWRLRLLFATLAGAAALGTLLLLAPACKAGAFGNLDPLVRDYWYVHINEGLPVWHQQFQSAAVLLGTPLCALACLFYLRQQRGAAPRAGLPLAAYFMLYAALLAMLVFRTVSVAAAFAIPVIAAVVLSLFHRYRRSESPVRRIGLVVIMLILMAPASVAGQIAALVHGQSVPDAARINSKQCQAITSIAALNRIPKARILAPFDMGPAILLTTPHAVLASSHHRNERAMHDHIAIFLSPPAAAKAIVDKYQIEYIALCKGEAELTHYAHARPNGLWGLLNKGQNPAWLEPMPPIGKNIQLWRVKEPKGGSR